MKISAPWEVDPRYSGPEYETEESLGSNCGVEDEKAVVMMNCIGFCMFFTPSDFNPCAFTPPELAGIVRAVTGWDTSTLKLMNMEEEP